MTTKTKRVIIGGDTVKLYASRASAVNKLRDMKIKPADYDHFITPAAGGKVACEIGRAQAHLATQMKRAAKRRIDAQRETKKRQRNGAASMTDFARTLILKGDDNATIWKKMQRRFELDETKRHYPAWYRGDMRRKGLLQETRA